MFGILVTLVRLEKNGKGIRHWSKKFSGYIVGEKNPERRYDTSLLSVRFFCLLQQYLDVYPSGWFQRFLEYGETESQNFARTTIDFIHQTLIENGTKKT